MPSLAEEGQKYVAELYAQANEIQAKLYQSEENSPSSNQEDSSK